MYLARTNAIVFQLLTIALIGFGVVRPAQAGLISTARLMEAAGQERAIGSLEQALARDEVQRQLARFGVSQDMLLERARYLTDQEVFAMTQNIENAVVGGDAVAIVGAVFIVLLILELVGVTDIFKAL